MEASGFLNDPRWCQVSSNDPSLFSFIIIFHLSEDCYNWYQSWDSDLGVVVVGHCKVAAAGCTEQMSKRKTSRSQLQCTSQLLAGVPSGSHMQHLVIERTISCKKRKRGKKKKRRNAALGLQMDGVHVELAIRLGFFYFFSFFFFIIVNKRGLGLV